MKYICILIYSMAIVSLCCNGVMASENVDFKILHGKKIILDPGHGGSDPGAVRFDTRESKLNIGVAKNLERYLSLFGASVTMTRNTDSETVSLNDRFDISESSNPDLFISLHHNDASENFYQKKEFKNVSEVYYGLINDAGYRNELLGMSFAREFESLYGVGAVNLKPGYFRVIRSKNIPSVLMEPFYMGDAKLSGIYGDDFYLRHEAMVYIKAIAGYFNSIKDGDDRKPPKKINEFSAETFEITLSAGNSSNYLGLLSDVLNASGHKSAICSDKFLNGNHISEFYIDKLKFAAPGLEPEMIDNYIEAIRSNSCSPKVHFSVKFDEHRPCAIYHYYRSDNGKKLAGMLSEKLTAAAKTKFSTVPDSFYILSSTQAVTVELNLNPCQINLNDGTSIFAVNMAVYKAISEYLALAEKK
ncbi:MAG TPA: N-acetylmuramoyl-L-alanine amidase [Candidatus Wallbacteria bacterium]|nr:N-acetylmuramoyl-L-alanine amidase [Candidatus Wallbacteria bacterium]